VEKGHHHHHVFDPEHLLRMEERRRSLLDPVDLMQRLLTRDDLILADIGCGVGFFAIPAAERLQHGRVFAVDCSEEMLAVVRRRAEEAGLRNLETVCADARLLPFADRSIDVALMANVFHDLADQEGALREARRVLKEGGRLHLVEWQPIPSDFGPPVELRIAPETLVGILDQGAFAVEALHTGSGPVYEVSARARA
jgi:ubiquinone/menaquinone biosynthesis C-methylase UbiE